MQILVAPDKLRELTKLTHSTFVSFVSKFRGG